MTTPDPKRFGIGFIPNIGMLLDNLEVKLQQPCLNFRRLVVLVDRLSEVCLGICLFIILSPNRWLYCGQFFSKPLLKSLFGVMEHFIFIFIFISMLLFTVLSPFTSLFLFLFRVTSLVLFLDPYASLFPRVLSLQRHTILSCLWEGDAIEIIFYQFLIELVHFVSDKVYPLYNDPSLLSLNGCKPCSCPRWVGYHLVSPRPIDFFLQLILKRLSRG